jgi:hypothetical protein
MRKILFLTCFLAGMLVACSNDDSGDNHVVADFQLQNEKGVECYDFQEGDNIIFKLEIRNDGDEEIILPPISEVIGFDIFRVYTKNGEDMGTPWDERFSSYVGHSMIRAYSSVVVTCPWFDISGLTFEGPDHLYSGCFIKKVEKMPLPIGEYYSKFDIKLNHKIVTCYRTFKIH